MFFKMRQHFVIYVFVVILFSQDCSACFSESTVTERIVSSETTFYEECCCTGDTGYTIYDLQWLDINNQVIGPDIYSNMYTEEQGECLALHIPSPSKPLSGTYQCTLKQNVDTAQKYILDVYDPLFFYNTTATQYLVQGRDSMVHCEAKGFSSPLIKWTRGYDGQDEITNSPKYQIVPGGVIIKNVVGDDDGIYKCSASVMSTGEELEIDIDVQVMTVPTIKRLTASPENVTIAGESLIIECFAEGLPEPEYSWRKITDLKPEEQAKLNTTWLLDNNRIHFTSTEPEDAGIYECMASNFAGDSNKTIEIKVLVPPTIIEFTNRTAVEGAEIPIHCNVTGIPPPNVTIVYEGKNFEEERTTSYEQYINNYSLLKVDRSKEGIYTCNATNEVGFESENMYLTVLHPPHFDESEKTIWGWDGERVALKCEPEANPPANITWRYIYTPKHDDAQDDVLVRVNEANMNEILAYEMNKGNSQNITIEINNKFTSYGLYECIVKNLLGLKVLKIHLREGHVPSKVANISVQETSATSATFIIDGYNDYIGPPVLGFVAEYDVAENYKITHIHHNRTWALDRPLKLGNLKPNVTYRIRFAAINRVGTGDWGEMIKFDTLEKSAPEPPIWQVDPLQFSLSNVLKWKEPEDNGEPIDYYALRYCPVIEAIDDSLCKEHRIEAATEIKLSDLQYNITYNFELIAHNVEGNSTAANITLSIKPVIAPGSEPLLSGKVIIGLSAMVVVVCLVLLDLLFLFWRQQGIIATCCFKKSKKKPNSLYTRDKKGLLKDNGENTDDTLRRPNNGHREYEYNKTTGIITGKHSSV